MEYLIGKKIAYKTLRGVVYGWVLKVIDDLNVSVKVHSKEIYATVDVSDIIRVFENK